MLPYEEFSKADLRVGTILSAERVEGSPKLLRLSVSLGDETRQIIAGIGKAYEPEILVNRQIAMIANLEPRMLMGLESQGMILAASDGTPVILSPERSVPPGTKIQ